MKFKVGDRVRVKEFENDGSLDYAIGNEYTIDEVNPNQPYPYFLAGCNFKECELELVVKGNEDRNTFKKLKVIGEVEYVMGHLRYGHYEVDVDKYEWETMSMDEKVEYIRDFGDFILDDYSINDIGSISNIIVDDIKED